MVTQFNFPLSPLSLALQKDESFQNSGLGTIQRARNRSDSMELSQIDPVYISTRPDEPELDLYTIPVQTSWFVWDEIHETERASLREFFDGGSISRTPKIYKEYRDFIINKYREEPSRRLKFTEVRKSLVGDVNLLHKVFLFLEKWGLINFSPSPSAAGDGPEARQAEEERARVRVKVEEGVPNGIRVVAMPNSIKPISAELTNALEDKTEVSVSASVESGVKLPPLASYSDVFADLIRQKDGIVCGNCSDRCNSGHYKYTKGDFSICTKCFKSGNYGENKSVDDYKFSEDIWDNRKYGAVWSEAETLVLLESVLKYGNNWELVVQNLPTKTKLDCIAKLIELPLGDVLGPATVKKGNNSNDQTGNLNSSTQDLPPLSENQEMVKIGDQHEKVSEGEQNGQAEEQGPPLKRQRIAPLSAPGGSLMEQVACISSMVDPYITAVAAEAAITSLCEENSWPREIFDADDDDGDSIVDGVPNSIADSETNGGDEVEGSVIEGGAAPSESRDSSTKTNEIPLSLRIRTAVATSLGAAAARAKLLADQEEREIENLVATVIGTEMKKVHCKIKHFEDLEGIMKKQHAEIDGIEDILIAERINVLQTSFKAGITRWKNHSSLRS